MNIRAAISIFPVLLAGTLLAGCAHGKHGAAAQSAVSGPAASSGSRSSWFQHVPPGQSLSEAMAKKPQVVALPIPLAPPAQPDQTTLTADAGAMPAAAPLPLPQTEKVADAFTLGNLCMQQGRYEDAIKAYESAVKDDPTFAEAWNNLAIAYQNSGQDEKAMAAFRKYKMVAVH